MRLAPLALAFTLLAAPALAKPERYHFDKEHTNLGFAVSHLGFSDMVGSFMTYDGGFEFDQEKPENSKVDVTIKPEGVRTVSAELDKHLQNEKFFNSAKFPEVRFVSTAVKVTGANEGTITGNLTLLGVTKPVTLNVRFNKGDYHPMTGDYIAGFRATGAIKRSEFGMGEYVPMVGDEVKLDFQVEGVNEVRKQDAKKK